jgi:methionyl-tRNA formyltransferase
MDEKMDEGDIISQKETIITLEDTTEKLHDRLSIMGRDLLLETLPSIFAGTNARIKQDHSKATYGFNVKREDEKIDFNKTRKEIFNQVRGLNSWPGAYALLDDHVLKVWEIIIGSENIKNVPNGTIVGLNKVGIEVKCSDGIVTLKLIQPEGKKKMEASSYLNGLKNKEELIGKVLV